MRVFALVIGNNDYPDPDKLMNAIADAQAMASVFKRLGYDTNEIYNFKQTDVSKTMSMLETELPKYDASILYYAGHGFQVEGENFLPAVDCQISYATKYDLRRESIVLSELLELYRPNSKKTNIVILDACRVRPSYRGGNDSFAPIDAPQGTLIAFSTSPNSSAKDGGADGHSLYTSALLSYIGRERLSVENLFKMVRRTVVQWPKNTQIPWEHTSLIGDFSFNTGQMVVSPQLPYSENVVKDAEYAPGGEFGELIDELKSYDFYRQNPAIDAIWRMKPSDLDKNQQFIFGRNLLQASAAAFGAQEIMSSLSHKMRKYLTEDGENHVLNGILFEIYFDSHGEFRGDKIKRHFFEEVLALRKYPDFSKSFEFIRAVLNPYKDALIYSIPEDDSKLDIDITLEEKTVMTAIIGEQVYSVISMVAVEGVDITQKVKNLFMYADRSIQEAIAIATNAPEDVVILHTNIPILHTIQFAPKVEDSPF